MALGQALGFGEDREFGGAHIGALAQQLGRHPGRQITGTGRQPVVAAQPFAQGCGRQAEQHREAVLGLRNRRLQRRQVGAQLLGGQARLFGVQRAGQPGLGAPARQRQGLLLGGEVVAGDAPLRAAAAQRGVGNAHLGSHRHAGGGQVGGGGGYVQLAPTQGGRLGAEEVRLPAGIQAGLPAADAAGGSRMAAAEPGAAAQLGRGAGGLAVTQRAGLVEPGAGDGQVGVALQRVVDQGDQQRVVELLPPARQGWAIQRSRGGRVSRRGRRRRRCHRPGGRQGQRRLGGR